MVYIKDFRLNLIRIVTIAFAAISFGSLSWIVSFDAALFLWCVAVTVLGWGTWAVMKWLLEDSKSARLNPTTLKLNELNERWQLSERRLSRIFDSNMIGLIYSDQDGKILEANDYFINLVGESHEALREGRMNWRNYTPPEYMPISEEALNVFKTSDFFPPFEKEYVRTDGRRVAVLVGVAKVDTSFMAFVIDLSERNKVESALAEAKNELEEKVALRTQQLTDANLELSRSIAVSEMTAERLKESRTFLDSVIENIPNMIFVKDARDLRFVRFNRGGEELLGRARSELIGRNDFDIFPVEQAEFFTRKDRDVLKSGRPLDITEEEISTPKGIRYLHTRKIPIADKNGQPQYLMGISEDITDLKRAQLAEIELRSAQAARSEAEKSASRLALLSDANKALSESLAMESMLNAFGSVVTQNMAELCLIDFYNDATGTIERAVGSGLSDQAPKLLCSLGQGGVSEVIRTGKSLLIPFADSNQLESVVHDPKRMSQLTAPRSMILVPLAYQGTLFGVLSLIAREGVEYGDLDLSMAEELARRASLAIENARLYRTAEEANRAKSAFLANISHELRTPLGAMLGFAELALDNERLPPEQVGYLNMISKNGRQLMQIVDEVLDLSKAESDLTQIEKTAFSLPKLISEVSSLLRIKADQKNLTLNLKTASNLPEGVYSDPLRLRQILLNIVGNAIKFTSEGSVTLAVEFVPTTADRKQGELVFRIQDTGIGLTVDQAGRIFEAFVQADNSTKRRFGGTGLGLFLSRKLARLMGGEVVLAKSTPGEGSEFHLTLPVSVTKAEVVRDSVTTNPPVSQRSFNSDSRVLVVDDSEDNRILLQSILKRAGLTVDTAVDGMQALDKAGQTQFDLILMDIQMPEMDGFEALKQLRERGYENPIVALTAHAMKGDREKGIQSGFDDYIYKPFDTQALRRCLTQYIPEKKLTLH